MTEKQKTIQYILFDLLSAVASWFLFYAYRVLNVEHSELVFKGSFWSSIILIPLFWLFLYTIQGTYFNVFRHHRLKSIKQTLFGTFIGVIIVFFVLLLNDTVYQYQQYYTLFIILFLLHFSLTLIPRYFLTWMRVKKIHKGILGFNTIIIGGNEKALEILKDIRKLRQNSGHLFIGFVNINGEDFRIKDELKHLGKIDDIGGIMRKNKVEEVIIALESTDHERLKGIMTQLAAFDVKINLIPDSYDILSGQVQMNSIFGALLIKANPINMPDWQFSTKRIIDITFSIFAIIILLPIYLIIAVLVKFSSKGPIFFSQERIGKHGKPFKIIKFRTMYLDSEKDGPQLSSSKDARITKIGRFLRKSRLDEFPQFWNVLKGDMSLVGPRPERSFYIEQISEHDSQYLYLNKVRPGITSWGQVKFGYAENVEQMLERMKYDLLYIRNMSLALDLKIMFYTIAIIFKGSGK